MILNILIWLSSLATLFSGVAVLLRRKYLVSTLLLCSALIFVTALGVADYLTFQNFSEIWPLRKTAQILEAFIAICFYFYTKTTFRDNSEIYRGPGFWGAVVVSFLLLVVSFSVPVSAFVFSPDILSEKTLFLTAYGFYFYVLLMVYFIAGLVQLERSYASIHPLQRWSIKTEVVGSGLLGATFALYFSQSLLYRSLNLEHSGFRSFFVIVACALIFYSRFFRDRSASRFSISRGIAQRSFVLLIVGSYLILLGILGEGLRYLQVADYKSVIYVLLLVGAAGLCAVSLSEQLRRKLKVTFHKNFFQAKYDYRQEWQKFAAKVGEGSSLPEVQKAILELFCDPLACKGSALYLRDFESADYLHVDAFNFPRDWRPFAAEDPLIRQLQERSWIINLRDENQPLEDSMIHTFRDTGVFLIVPMFFDEELYGFVVLADQINRENLTYEDYDLLKMLSRQSIAIIHGLRLSEQLTASREMAAIGKVSTFVLHDLKNQVSGLSLMLDNARDYIDDPEFQEDMLETIGNTVRNMNGLIARLKNLKEKPSLAIERVQLGAVVSDAVDTVRGNIELSGDPVSIAADNEEIYKVLMNLLVNAVEASPAGSCIHVCYGLEGDKAFVTVTDSGCGMAQEFIDEKLFTPFLTTKKHGFGIGLYQCRQIIESHGGEIDVVSEVGKGSTFRILLPVAD